MKYFFDIINWSFTFLCPEITKTLMNLSHGMKWCEALNLQIEMSVGTINHISVLYQLHV